MKMEDLIIGLYAGIIITILFTVIIWETTKDSYCSYTEICTKRCQQANMTYENYHIKPFSYDLNSCECKFNITMVIQ
jgi:hypothetical protein